MANRLVSDVKLAQNAVNGLLIRPDEVVSSVLAEPVQV